MNRIFFIQNLEITEVNTDLGVCSATRDFFGEDYDCKNLRFYKGPVSLQNDVTPNTSEEVVELENTKGEFTVIDYPGALEVIALVLAAVSVAIALASVFLFKPPNPTDRNIKSESPNNGLSSRTNSVRLEGRIPDIFGTVRSVPDLIALPFVTYENNVEIEHAYMCIGRGKYSIDSTKIKDGETPASDIDGMSVRVYGPYTSPNSSSDPQLSIGDSYTQRIDTVYRTDAVNGQVLHPPNDLDGNDSWVGPFIMTGSNIDEIFCNIVGLSGLYKDDGETQTAITATVEIEVTPLDRYDVATGSPTTSSVNIVGSATSRSSVGVTKTLSLTAARKYSIRARRTDNRDLETQLVVDEIKWKDAYAVEPTSLLHFGDITTIQTRTRATEGSLSVKSRKLNCEAKRIIQVRTTGGDFIESVTNRSSDILLSVIEDPYIGGYSRNNVDLDSLYGAYSDLYDYFGDEEFTEFSYTFDKENVSFEETIQIICNASFTVPYRVGSTITFKANKKEEISTILFNHRNKLPNSEQRRISFGNLNNHDGVELKWVEPLDDSVQTMILPVDSRPINPKKISTVGVRSGLQAHMHCWRAWNRIRYQREVVKVPVTQEGALLVRTDRIVVTDNTRSETQCGEIVSQLGLTLTLSNTIRHSSKGYSIFIQHEDGTIVSADTSSHFGKEITLTSPLAKTLYFEEPRYCGPTYELVEKDTNVRSSLFLVEGVAQGDSMTYDVNAVNWDERYWQNDTDFKDGTITTESDGLFMPTPPVPPDVQLPPDNDPDPPPQNPYDPYDPNYIEP